MSVSGFSRPRVLLHWLSPVVILWVLMSGFYVSSVEGPAQIKQSISVINVSLTTVLIPFFILRLCLVFCDARPLRVKSLSFTWVLARLVHVAIYLAVSVVLVSGVLMMNRPISVFALFEFPQPLSDQMLISRFLTLHIEACLLLSLLLVLHIGAMIFQQARGHRALRRMHWPPRGDVVRRRHK